MGKKTYLINGMISILLGLALAGFCIYAVLTGQSPLNKVLIYIIIGIVLVVFGLIIVRKSNNPAKATA